MAHPPKSLSSLQNKELHEIIENDFNRLIDIIEQKQLIHEPVDLPPPQHTAQHTPPTSDLDAIDDTLNRLKQYSQALNASTLTEYFAQIQDTTKHKTPVINNDLLNDIRGEFERLKSILQPPSTTNEPPN